MTPAQILARLVSVALIAGAVWWTYRQVAVVLPEVRAELKQQKDATKAAEAERDAAKKQVTDLQEDQAEVAEQEAANEEERRRLADLGTVLGRLAGMCQQSARGMPARASAANPSGQLAQGLPEAGDQGDGQLAGLAAELREVPSDDANHEALASQWCKLKRERGERQPGCE